MSRILVTGGKGQLGSELKSLEASFSEYCFCFTDAQVLDITNHRAVENFVTANNIQIIVNCAAHTAVDKAESELELSEQLNHLAVENLAKIAKEKEIQLIHISTDYVFDGSSKTPYLETDLANPQSVYGLTKLAGERAMQKINPSHSAIIRTSWVYSSYGNNFVKTMLRLGKEREQLKVVSDQIGTPTYARDLAKAILAVLPKLNNTEVEILNYSNEGVCSWYDFAKAIFEFSGISMEVYPIATSHYPSIAKRPFYSVLNKEKIKDKYALEIPHWNAALKDCLYILGKEENIFKKYLN